MCVCVCVCVCVCARQKLKLENMEQVLRFFYFLYNILLFII